MVLTFGKFKGTDLEAVPSDYIVWCLENFRELNPRIRSAMIEEMQRRSASAPPAASDLEAELHSRIGSWFRDLARDYHPDRRGGSSEAMAALNDARGRLLRVLGLESARA